MSNDQPEATARAGRRRARPLTAARAVVALFVITALLSGISNYFTTRTADHLRNTQQAQARAERTQAQTVRTLDETVRTLKRTVRSLRRQVRSGCRFDGDLGGVPVSVNPATGKASVLGVKIVSDSRVAWHQAGCPGTLEPPAPSFAHWAAYYHLPAG